MDDTIFNGPALRLSPSYRMPSEIHSYRFAWSTTTHGWADGWWAGECRWGCCCDVEEEEFSSLHCHSERQKKKNFPGFLRGACTVQYSNRSRGWMNGRQNDGWWWWWRWWMDDWCGSFLGRLRKAGLCEQEADVWFVLNTLAFKRWFNTHYSVEPQTYTNSMIYLSSGAAVLHCHMSVGHPCHPLCVVACRTPWPKCVLFIIFAERLCESNCCVFGCADAV